MEKPWQVAGPGRDRLDVSLPAAISPASLVPIFLDGLLPAAVSRFCDAAAALAFRGAKVRITTDCPYDGDFDRVPGLTRYAPV